MASEAASSTVDSGRSSQEAAPGPDDADLVALARKGDTDAFEQLVRRHISAVLGTAGAVLRGNGSEEDVCQEAFLLALERLEQCREPERFRAWLLAITRRQAIRALRASGREAPSGQPELLGRPERLGVDTAIEIRLDVRRAMLELTHLQRTVLLLHDLEGWKHREIGSQLGITAGSSRVHLYVARKAMRKMLGPRYTEALT